MKSANIKQIISIESAPRLDQYLSQNFPDHSRTYFQTLIRNGNVKVNEVIAKPSQGITAGDIIEVKFLKEILKSRPEPEDIKLNIIYEDQNVIVVNKPAGLVVHPAAGNEKGTLVNALINYFPQIREAVYEKGNSVSESRPGLVHRLDKDTSGLLIVAKNPRSMHSLSAQIQKRTVKKIYLAFCAGWLKDENGILTNYLGRDPNDRRKIADVGQEKGREAISYYKVLDYLNDKYGNKISLVEFEIKTGRTHQIRIQSKLLGHPVLGDQFYNTKESEKIARENKISRQLLHAHKLTVYLLDKKDPDTFEAVMPDDFKTLLQNLTAA